MNVFAASKMIKKAKEISPEKRFKFSVPAIMALLLAACDEDVPPIDPTIISGTGDGDTIVPTHLPEDIFGYAGVDLVEYANSPVGVTAYLDGTPGIGGSAEGDMLHMIENLTGSEFDDKLVGNAEANIIMGLGGDDLIMGGAGDDELMGGDGADTLMGGKGADILNGGAGIDLIDYSLSNTEVSINLAAGTGFGGDAADDILIDIENVNGSGFSDTIMGNADDNILRGNAGNDVLSANDGDDIVYGGVGDDTLDGGNGADQLYGEDGDDRIYARAGDDELVGGIGADRLDGGSGIDLANYSQSTAGVSVNLFANTASGGHAEGDTLFNIENLTGSGFDDRLAGNAGINIIDGRGGNDTIDYLDSNEAVDVDLSTGTVAGGYAEGDILISIENITGSAFDDRLMGDENVNIFDGGDGIDTLDYSNATGRIEADLIYGQGYYNYAQDDVIINIENLIGSIYDDVLCGNGEANRLDGNDGFDSTTYATSDAAVSVDLLTGAASGGFATGDLLINIEGVIGSAFDDHLCGDEGANNIDGRDGIDTTSYYQSNEGVNINLAGGTAFGGHAEGDLISNLENLIGSGFNDSLGGDEGANILDGADGEDFADYSLSDDTVNIDLSADTAFGGHAEGDELDNIENLIGSEFADNLSGDNGRNELVGLAGNDVINGLGGNDTLIGGEGEDALVGGEGQDILFGEAHDDVLFGGGGNDTLNGGTGIDQLYGNNGDDTLIGGEGNDTLKGGDGDDNLEGGAGLNALDGGAGFDSLNADDVQIIDYIVLRGDNKVEIELTQNGVVNVDTVKAVEVMNIDNQSIDLKTIWSDLASEEKGKFIDEADFLNWLGDDAGYNYEGL